MALSCERVNTEPTDFGAEFEVRCPFVCCDVGSFRFDVDISIGLCSNSAAKMVNHRLRLSEADVSLHASWVSGKSTLVQSPPLRWVKAAPARAQHDQRWSMGRRHIDDASLGCSQVQYSPCSLEQWSTCCTPARPPIWNQEGMRALRQRYPPPHHQQ